ncbi:unnamed protein product [Anisakis simplex]|uniref:Uncharacterized protein n=1 Tax=Anisakis simplex TaxID=6269 RepID=A0A3P6PH50_ANISI|nr:unnamed protein product [Anisakis simplex]
MSIGVEELGRSSVIGVAQTAMSSKLIGPWGFGILFGDGLLGSGGS